MLLASSDSPRQARINAFLSHGPSSRHSLGMYTTSRIALIKGEGRVFASRLVSIHYVPLRDFSPSQSSVSPLINSYSRRPSYTHLPPPCRRIPYIHPISPLPPLIQPKPPKRVQLKRKTEAPVGRNAAQKNMLTEKNIRTVALAARRGRRQSVLVLTRVWPQGHCQVLWLVGMVVWRSHTMMVGIC